MADIVDRKTRSRMMSGIKGKDTRPEMVIRKALHARGLRYRLHDKELSGKPDLVFPKYRAVIFVHGCFWHGHDCHLFKLPASNTVFWKTKINRNRENDRKSFETLREKGWRILTVWECSLKGRIKLPHKSVSEEIHSWLMSDSDMMIIKGKINDGPSIK